jgi:uncharacterized protein (TIGR03435 family)
LGRQHLTAFRRDPVYIPDSGIWQRQSVVRDRTGLTEHYDLDASWTPDTRPPGPQAFGVGPATFAALEEQLGLRLMSETGPVEGLVIDRVEKPVQD